MSAVSYLYDDMELFEEAENKADFTWAMRNFEDDFEDFIKEMQNPPKDETQHKKVILERLRGEERSSVYASQGEFTPPTNQNNYR